MRGGFASTTEVGDVAQWFAVLGSLVVCLCGSMQLRLSSSNLAVDFHFLYFFLVTFSSTLQCLAHPNLAHVYCLASTCAMSFKKANRTVHLYTQLQLTAQHLNIRLYTRFHTLQTAYYVWKVSIFHWAIRVSNLYHDILYKMHQ